MNQKKKMAIILASILALRLQARSLLPIPTACLPSSIVLPRLP